MIFTVIGIALRCLTVTAWGSKESLQGFCNVLFVVYIILSVLGLIDTYLCRYKKSPAVTIITFIAQIAAFIYFTFAADSLIGKIIGGIIVFIIFLPIFDLLPNSHVSSDKGDEPGFLERFAEGVMEAEEERIRLLEQNEQQNRQREEKEKAEREKMCVIIGIAAEAD